MKSDVYEKPVPKPYKKGVVDDCTLLNLRAEPNDLSDVCVILQSGTEVMVDPDFETNDFYRVIVKSMLHRNKYSFSYDYHGYCSKKFIKV